MLWSYLPHALSVDLGKFIVWAFDFKGWLLGHTYNSRAISFWQYTKSSNQIYHIGSRNICLQKDLKKYADLKNVCRVLKCLWTQEEYTNTKMLLLNFHSARPGTSENQEGFLTRDISRGAMMNLSLLDLPDNESRTGSDSPRFEETFWNGELLLLNLKCIMAKH